MNPQEHADTTVREQGSMVPQENEIRKNNPWEPGSTGIQVQGHETPEEITNWHQLVRNPCQQETDYKETRSSNPIEFVRPSGSSRTASSPFLKRFGIEDVESVLNSYSHVDSNWSEGNFTNLLLGSSSSNLCLDNQNSSGSRSEMPRGELPASLWPRYNLNSPPKLQAGVLSNTHNLPPSTTVTPDDPKQLENHQTLNSSAYSNSDKEKHNTKTSLKSTGTDAADDRCKEIHQRSKASSSEAICTPSKKKKKEENKGSDHCKKTRQKGSKKRKHRPKVIKEDGPKKRTKN